MGESGFEDLTLSFLDGVEDLLVNETLLCAARNIRGPVQLPFHPAIYTLLRCLQIIFYIVVLPTVVTLNSFVLYLVWKFKTFHTPQFALASQVVVINLVAAVNNVAVGLLNAIANQWLLGLPMCIIVGAVYYFCNLLRRMLLLTLVIEQFCSVFFPYLYPKYRKKVVCGLTFVCYFVSAVITAAAGVLDCFIFSTARWICAISSCSVKCTIFQQVAGMGLFLPISVVPIFLFWALYLKAKKARLQEAAAVDDGDGIKQRERRASVTFFLMFLVLFVATVPFGILGFILNVSSVAANPAASLWLYLLRVISGNGFHTPLVVDPLFILRNKDTRDVLTKLPWIPGFIKRQL